MRRLRTISIIMLACATVLPVAVTAAYLDLQKTGQTQTYAKLDDGDITSGAEWPLARFVDNTDGTLTDKLTNLMWLKDASCADTSGFISGNNVTNWAQAFEFVEKLNTNALNVACQQYTEKYSDWRIPTVTELATLIRAGLTDKTNAEWLNVPGTPSSGFVNTGFIHNSAWTSTTYAADNNKAWVISLANGEMSIVNKTNDTHFYAIFSAVRATNDPARVASSGQTTSYTTGDDGTTQHLLKSPQPRFVDRENGTVVDRLSGLMWLKNASCATPQLSWSTALGTLNTANASTPNFPACDGYTAKYRDWRLPNIKELQSLIDYGQSNPTLPSGHPFIVDLSVGAVFWSGTSGNTDPDSYAWTVSLIDGQTAGNTPKSASNMLSWPVRGPIDYADLSTSPELIEFGEAFVGQEQIAPRTIKIFSTGTTDLNIGNLQIDNTLVERLEFTLGHDTCSGKTLKHGETCIVEVVFKPRQAGLRHTTLRIPSDSLGLPLIEAPIQGTGVNAADTGISACFIATAAYGSYLEPEVQYLRQFRDQYLLTHSAGRWLVRIYYANSPPIAHWIAQHEAAKWVIRGLLTPVIHAIKYPLFTLALLLAFITLWVRRRVFTPT